MRATLYSERRRASIPRDVDAVNDRAWISLRERILLSFRQQQFAESFPVRCPTCRGVLKTNESAFQSVLMIEIPSLDWADIKRTSTNVGTNSIFDIIEFSYSSISEATRTSRRRANCGHRPLNFAQDPGRARFLNDVNRIFEREKIRFQLNDDGKIVRLGAPILSDLIDDAIFNTDDSELDEFLVTAMDKFISRDPEMHREALKDLWDAWERLKTLEVDQDKLASATTLLDRTATGPMRDRLETEARELTNIGNDFMIRHSETDRHPITDDRHVDYLFHRMFSLVYVLLDATGRLDRSNSSQVC